MANRDHSPDDKIICAARAEFLSCGFRKRLSTETLLNGLMDRKGEQTAEFFSQTYGKTPNADALRLLMGSQFWCFRQMLDAHLPEDDMAACLKVILDFTKAGWRQFCNDPS